MPQSMAAPSDRQAASLATGVLLGVGVALYQMTSLVLAPAANQRISLSLRTLSHEPALLVPSGRGSRPRAPLSVPAMTPVKSSVVPRVDPETRKPLGGDGVPASGAVATDLHRPDYHDAVPVELDWFVVGDVGLEVNDDARRSRGAILGGAAARLAAHGAALGMKVAIAGKVGDDDAGAQVAHQLHTLGIDLRWLLRAPGLRTTVWHETREHPESRRLERGVDNALRLDELPTPALLQARLTVVSGFSLSVEPARSAAVRALQTADRRDGRAALLLEADRLWSTNARMTRRVLEPALAASHTVALNGADMRALFGARATSKEAARTIAQMGPRIVYVQGNDGSALLYESGRSQLLVSARPDGPPADRFAGPAAFWTGLARGVAPKKAAMMGLEYAATIRRAGAPRHPVQL